MKKSKTMLLIGVIVIIAIAVVVGYKKMGGIEHNRKITIESGGPHGISFNENANIRLDDSELVDAKLEYDNSLKKYVIILTAKKSQGKTMLYINDVKGKIKKLDITVTNNSIGYGNSSEVQEEMNRR